MAKDKINKSVIAALKLIHETGRATQAIGEPLVNMGLIEVNTKDLDEHGAAAARLTQKGIANMPKNANVSAATPAAASNFKLIDNAVLPESKRGFGRVAGVSKYPFADMKVGHTFFVPNSEVESGDALKKLTSTVSNMNNKYRTDTGETEEKVRTKRGDGNKAVLDAEGNKIKETVEVSVYKQDRKFSIRGVKSGETYGAWKAPEDGALIGRTL